MKASGRQATTSGAREQRGSAGHGWAPRLCLLASLVMNAHGVLRAQYHYAVTNGLVTINRYVGPGGDLDIPDTIEGLPVRTVGHGAFEYRSDLRRVTIPASVDRIAGKAFNSCRGLTSLGIPGSVSYIGDSAFYGCHLLTNIQLPESLVGLGSAAFEWCSSLTEVALPKGLRKIEPSTFANSGLIAITLPDTVTNVGKAAFGGCRRLSQVTLGSGLTTIESLTFAECVGLRTLAIPDNVRRILSEGPGPPNGIGGAFQWSGLNTVTMGKGVVWIAPYAFAHCQQLAGVYFEGNPPIEGSTLPSVFQPYTPVTIYYLPDAHGWTRTYCGRPTAVWRPLIENESVEAGRFGFTIRWASDRVVVVEACADLVNPVWSAVETPPLPEGVARFSDRDGLAPAARWYRVRSP